MNVYDISSAVVQCGNLSSPVNGQVSVDSNTFGSQANYSCSEGYVLNGNSIRMCQSDGQWSGSEPTCEGQNLLCVCIMCGSCFICIDMLCGVVHGY